MVHITQMLTFFGILCLIFLTGIASYSDETLSEKSQCIEPIFYEMNIFPQIQTNSFSVESRAKINVPCRQRNIRLYFGRYCDQPKMFISSDSQNNFTSVFWDINSVVFSTEGRFNSLHITIVSVDRGTNETNRLTYLQSGKYWIHANYNCSLEKVATVFSYVQQSEETQYLILPRIPAEWIFPCWENPANKATFIIRIIHASNEIALSHTRGTKMFARNETYTLFPITPLMSTYLVAIAVVPFEIYIYSNRSQILSTISYAVSLITNITAYVTYNWQDVPQSHVFYRVLPLNSSHYETIITKNLVFFNEAAIIYDKNIDSLTQNKKVTCLVARSVIQEIFSDWVATFKQSESWFMEGFSNFYGLYIIDQIFGQSLLKSLVVQTRRGILDFIEAIITYDLPVTENSPSIPKSSIFLEVWRKSAINLFYMVTDKHVLYNFMFEKAINLYYNTSRDTYTTQSNFDILWSKLLSEMPTHKNTSFLRILTTVITSWTHVGYPLVQVNRHNNTRTLEILIRDCFLSNIEKSCVSTWWIPVTYTTIRQSNIKYQSYLQPDENNIIVSNIEEDDSAIFIDVPGYRVNYDRKSWKNIALFLKTTPFNMLNLSDITLAQILDDAFYFLIQNTDYNENSVLNTYENLNIFFDIANNVFHMNNSYIAWYPIFTAFEYLSKMFPFSESAYIKYKILVVVNTFLEYSSHTPSSENNVINQLYYEVLKWACILDSIKCKDIVMAELTWHIHNPARNRLLPSWQKWIFCQSLMVENSTYENSSTWYTLKTMHETQSKVEEMFKFLLCSRLRRNIFLSFNFFAINFLPSYGRSIDLKKSDKVSFLFNLFTRHSKTLASLTSILEEIRSIESDNNIHAIMNCIINNIHSDEGLSMVRNEKFVQMLRDRHRAPSYVIYAVKKKVDDRRDFLVKVKNNFFPSDKMHLFTEI
ncbi:aminopeptidase N-like isoform X2 [Pseudomyrmex gracilis]|nr:aminopeptidase N-like isoform X2 [Pseudomyrmex gracilis]